MPGRQSMGGSAVLRFNWPVIRPTSRRSDSSPAGVWSLLSRRHRTLTASAVLGCLCDERANILWREKQRDGEIATLYSGQASGGVDAEMPNEECWRRLRRMRASCAIDAHYDPHCSHGWTVPVQRIHPRYSSRRIIPRLNGTKRPERILVSR